MCIYRRFIFDCKHEIWGGRVSVCSVGENYRKRSTRRDCSIKAQHGLQTRKLARRCARCVKIDRAFAGARSVIKECRVEVEGKKTEEDEEMMMMDAAPKEEEKEEVSVIDSREKKIPKSDHDKIYEDEKIGQGVEAEEEAATSAKLLTDTSCNATTEVLAPKVKHLEASSLSANDYIPRSEKNNNFRPTTPSDRNTASPDSCPDLEYTTEKEIKTRRPRPTNIPSPVKEGFPRSVSSPTKRKSRLAIPVAKTASTAIPTATYTTPAPAPAPAPTITPRRVQSLNYPPPGPPSPSKLAHGESRLPRLSRYDLRN